MGSWGLVYVLMFRESAAWVSRLIEAGLVQQRDRSNLSSESELLGFMMLMEAALVRLEQPG